MREYYNRSGVTQTASAGSYALNYIETDDTGNITIKTAVSQTATGNGQRGL